MLLNFEKVTPSPLGHLNGERSPLVSHSTTRLTFRNVVIVKKLLNMIAIIFDSSDRQHSSHNIHFLSS